MVVTHRTDHRTRLDVREEWADIYGGVVVAMSTVDSVQSEIRSAAWVIRKVAHAASDTQLAAPSSLPNWTRAHVFAHICGFSHAMARQWEYALRGELIEQYTGGYDGRDAEIEALVAGSPEELKADIDLSLDRLNEAMDLVPDWSLPISYRQGDAFGGLEAVWREFTIHLVDVDLGVDSDAWSESFCLHLFDFLAPRLPAGLTLTLDGGVEIGAGADSIRVSGAHQDVAAWLAGREPIGQVGFGGADEPDLGPWPARRN
jgi:maleylpyruvate isomerase